MILQKINSKRTVMLRVTRILLWALLLNSLALIFVMFVNVKSLFTSVVIFSQTITTNSDEPLPAPPIKPPKGGGVVLLPNSPSQTEQIPVSPITPTQTNSQTQVIVPPPVEVPNDAGQKPAENPPANQPSTPSAGVDGGQIHPSASQQEIIPKVNVTQQVGEQKPVEKNPQLGLVVNFFRGDFCAVQIICILVMIEIILMVLLFISACSLLFLGE